MINFRFHLVSLVAVFLALTVGIVMGATVIDRAIVDGLNDRIDAVGRKADQRKKESDAFGAEVSRLNEFVDEATPYIVEGRLPGVPVVVVATRGVSSDAVKAQVDVLKQAGATVAGVVWLETSWALKGGDADKLATALGESSHDPTALREAAWRALATRLHDGQASPVITTPTDAQRPNTDVLANLVSAGFVQLDSLGNGQIDEASFPGRDAHAVLITGAGSDPGNLVRAGARFLSTAGMPTVVGEIYAAGAGQPDRGETLATIRGDGALSGVSTVDDVEISEGRIAVALASSDLGRQPPVAGHYGYGDGATRALPPFRPAS
jgi:hypothetical protein